MNLIKKIFVMIILTACFVFSQFNPGAKQIALSNSDIALSNDVFCLFSNPAGIAQINWREAGIFYSPSPFGMTELANGFFAYNEPSSLGNFGLGIMTYGFELYRENKISIAYAYNYNNFFFAGFTLNYNTLSIQNYGSDQSITLNLGGLVYLMDNTRFAFSLTNINRGSYGEEKDQIPVLYSVGFSYDILNNISVNFSVEKEIRYNSSAQFGINYDLMEYVSLRTGFSTYPKRFSAGLGINYSFFEFDYAMFNHQELGFTHQFGVLISFGGEGNRTDKIKKYLKKD